MVISFDQIKQIVLGAVGTEVSNGMICFDRMTPEQRDIYKARQELLYTKSGASSGIKLMFTTDSKSLGLDVNVERASGRTYFSFDVTADGKLVGTINNYSHLDMNRVYVKDIYQCGDFSGEISLGEGEKLVCIYFPWSLRASVRRLTLDDGAFIKPYKPAKKIIMYGDSITQGYEGLNPSMLYAERFGAMMDAEIFNKGIGAECFHPPLAKLGDDISPDFITVAYGTNDWGGNLSYNQIFSNCREFFGNLIENYGDCPIFGISPIWRKDCEDHHEFGEFTKIADCMRKSAEPFKNVKIIDGFNFVPHDEKSFADLYLHPNNDGFVKYAESLYYAISKEL